MTAEQRTEGDEEVNSSSILTYIVLVICGIFFYGRYMYSLPSESTDISATAIIQSCGGMDVMNNYPQHHLCDPNNLIGSADSQAIMNKINQIESYYDMKYGLGFVGGDTTSSNDSDPMPLPTAGNLKMSVFVIDEVSKPVADVKKYCS